MPRKCVFGVYSEWCEDINEDASPVPVAAALARLGHEIGRSDVPPCVCGWRHVRQAANGEVACAWCDRKRPELFAVRCADGH